MDSCCTLRLGLPTKEFLEELRVREETIEKILKAQQTVIMAGVYDLDTEIKARIIRCSSINHFIFKTTILTSDHYRMMRAVRKIKYQNGSLMYLARPYTSDLGQIKLYDENTKVYRCRIEDLYTINCRGCLKMQATIMLIDVGRRCHRVNLEHLYDTPQMISYYKEIEAEAKFGRIYLDGLVSKEFSDKSINQYFCDTVRKDPNREYKMKILGFEDDIYHVDLIDHKNKSLIAHIGKKFQDKIKKFQYHHEEADHGNDYVRSELEVVRQLVPSLRTTKNFNRSAIMGRFVRPISRESSTKRYHGVVQYFKEKILAIDDNDNSKSFLQKRFFRVKVICWDDPETFFVIPDDPDYYSYHSEFTKELEASQEIFDDKQGEADRPFVKGQTCLFKNEFDYKLGKWLRGVIIEVPSLTRNGNISTPNETFNGDIKIEWESTNTRPQKGIDKFVYKVRSIDYGFQCIRSPLNLAHVKNEQLFSCKGPWSLRCRLFGIEPIEYDTESSSGHPSFCLEMIDSWMRTKILDTGKLSYLSVLFRTNIIDLPNIWQSDDSKVDISLFHRHEPPYRIEESMMPRKRKSQYECLNWFLVERGLANHYIQGLKGSSNIELDQHIVNLLVPHDRI